MKLSIKQSHWLNSNQLIHLSKNMLNPQSHLACGQSTSCVLPPRLSITFIFFPTYKWLLLLLCTSSLKTFLCVCISTQRVSMGFGPREGSHLMFGFLIYNLQKKKAGSMEILSKPINSCPKLCGNILRENGPFQYISLFINCFMLEY